MAFGYTGDAEAGGSGTSASVTHGLTINAGDLVCFYVNSNHNSSAPSVDADAGASWTEEWSEAISGQTAHHAFAWKIANGSEPSSYAWSTGNAAWRVLIKVFTSATDAEVDVAAATDNENASGAQLFLECEAQSGAAISNGAVSIIVGGKDVRTSARDYDTADNSYVSVIGDREDQCCAMAHRIWTTGTGPAVVKIDNTEGDDEVDDTTYSGHISFVESSAGVTLTADPGALILSGATAALAQALASTPGTLLLTGSEATLRVATRLQSDPSVLQFTGADAALALGLVSDPGALLFTGAEADLTVSRLLQADPSALQLTGAVAELKALLVGDPGALQFTGAEADLIVTRLLQADPGALQFTGAAALLAARMLADPGALLFTGAVADLVEGTPDVELVADPGALLFTGADAALVDSTPVLVVRRGGVRFLREPDAEVRQEKVKELTAIIQPAIKAARLPGQPVAPLPSAISHVVSEMPPGRQRRVDRLLQETGISLAELLIILK